MTPELYWLTLSIASIGLLWIPYLLQLIVQLGVVDAFWDPTGAHPHDAKWALRAKRAHYNAIENIAVFAPLTIMVVMLGLNDTLTATTALVYFVVRLAHYFIYIAALPVIRSVAFFIGFVCQIVMAGRLLGVV
jgi:uncharacterized MAPEG superfamily protein